MRKITVEASTSYPVLIGEDLLKYAGREIGQYIHPCKAAIITDDIVAPLYEKTVRISLEEAGFSVCSFAFAAGEASKRIATLSDALEYLASQEITREDIIVALGGGVVGDLAGFAAAVYQRGIRFVQIPTTLLAAVDSSVGGKTAVDLEHGKNLAGAFHQPHLVLCDTHTLKTLPKATFADGVAEIIKYGILGNAALFEKMSTDNWQEDMEEIIETCVCMKRDMVQEDEFDTGKRQLLNLGHTLGHAIEQKSNFTMTHGHAVAIGLHLIARAAEQKQLAPVGIANQIADTLKKNNLPTQTNFTAQEITAGTLMDKKRRGGEIPFIFPQKIGVCSMIKISVTDVADLIRLALS